MLWLNFFRDLRSTLSRMVSVMIITMIAVLVYVALGGIPYNVSLFCSRYYETQNTADYWIAGSALDRADCRALAALPEVTGVQPRIVLDAQERGNSAVTIALYAVPDFEMNTPYLTEGALPASSRQMAVSERGGSTFLNTCIFSLSPWKEENFNDTLTSCSPLLSFRAMTVT